MTTHPNPCPTCRGDGKILVGEGRGELLTCPMCRGTGKRKEASS